MITKEEFFNFINKLQEIDKHLETISDYVFGDKYAFVETKMYQNIIELSDIFLESHFTDKGVDWIDYYLGEEDKVAYIKEECDLFDREVKYSLNTLDELWNFLNTNVKLYFKNVE